MQGCQILFPHKMAHRRKEHFTLMRNELFYEHLVKTLIDGGNQSYLLALY